MIFPLKLLSKTTVWSSHRVGDTLSSHGHFSTYRAQRHFEATVLHEVRRSPPTRHRLTAICDGTGNKDFVFKTGHELFDRCCCFFDENMCYCGLLERSLPPDVHCYTYGIDNVLWFTICIQHFQFHIQKTMASAFLVQSSYVLKVDDRNRTGAKPSA